MCEEPRPQLRLRTAWRIIMPLTSKAFALFAAATPCGATTTRTYFTGEIPLSGGGTSYSYENVAGPLKINFRECLIASVSHALASTAELPSSE